MVEVLKINIFQKLFNHDVKDCIDLMNSIVTPAILLLFSSIVSIKSYILSPITCFCSNPANIINFENYVESFCWVSGTIPLAAGKTPIIEADWKNLIDSTKIDYYQWIPLLLLLQALLYSLPSFIWKISCHNNHGTDLTIILKKAKDLAEDYSDNKKLEHLVGCLEDLFFVHRDYRHDIMSQVRRNVHKKCRFFISSKRLATNLSINYLFIKLLYLLNGIGQLALISKALNIEIFSVSTLSMFNIMSAGEHLNTTKYFPLVTFCVMEGVRSVGVTDNVYVAQCVLPINMLNEKIFIFLIVWVFMIIILTMLSLILWLNRLGNITYQIHEVKKYLKMRQSYRKMDKLTIRRFVQQFLRMDGMFILLMINVHAGDVVTSTIMNTLYRTFQHKYKNMDFNHDKTTDEIESLSLKLEPGGKGSVKMSLMKPTAPVDKDYLL